jgi:hypothetical protein
LTAEQFKNNPRLKEQYDVLKTWAAEPMEISQETIEQFTGIIRTGLMNEGHRKPAHTLHYINWILSTIESRLRAFNKQLRQYS